MTARLHRPLRLALAAALLVCGTVELITYPAEWQIASANSRLENALRQPNGANQVTSVNFALELSRRATEKTPYDVRAALAYGTALTMLRKGGDAVNLLEPVIAHAERPELVVALGRALAATGDDSGAHKAFLRAAWAAPASIATLPKAVRIELLSEVASLEGDLTSRRLSAPPPMPRISR